MSTDTPLACDLSAIDDDELEPHKENGKSVFGAIREYRELPAGYAFRLPAETETVERAGGFIARERLCCPFFKFSLEVNPDHGPVWLKITGDGEVKNYIENTILEQIGRDGGQ